MKVKALLATAAAVATVAFGAATTASADSKPGIWSGAYLGVNAGYGWNKFVASSIGSSTIDGKGFLGGVHGGYNWQSSSLVYGIEGDYDFSNVKGSTSGTSGGVTVDTRVKSLGSLRGRVGVIVSPQMLVFGTAGYGFGRASVNAVATAGGASASGSSSGSIKGLVIGGGLEYKMMHNVSLRGDLSRYFSKTDGGSPVSTPSTVIRTGLTYHIN